MTEIFDPKQGFVSDRTNETEFAAALAAAVDYRGDVTISLDNGSEELGYLFDMTGDMLSGNIGFMTKEDTSPRRLPQKNLLRPHGPGCTAHRPVWLIRAWRARKRGGGMSGRAASRECRNAGDRPASWNGRTAAGRARPGSWRRRARRVGRQVPNA